MNSEEREETRKIPLSKPICIQIGGSPAYTNPSPGKYLRKGVKGKSEDEIG